ncbi:hypothetical protein MSMTP_2125 [Methanosarcina sp. MTP4]|uniref:hypothetical protein n=1 Tax=Methanosarcina sp. MTP4 TaxID=1434100 RepID=UPI000615EA47|nr:hypothetical protein [Methanosarcina sp. MTP4]AKB25594.1 hypothetical protein MSMTP_2125 [Methanosarcina sp. MTP4]
MKSKILLVLILIGIVALSGCTDISDSYKPGSFGATEEEQQIVDAVTEKYGDMTADGAPRLLEVMMTSSTQNFIPVDKVLKYSKDSEKLYAWFIYDNFEYDIINVEWIYLDNDYSIYTFESETGEDFGRGTFILEKPDDGWPLGDYKVIISGAGVQESVEFEIIDGATVSIPLDLLDGTTMGSQQEDFGSTGTTDAIPTPQSGFRSESTSHSFVGEWSSNWGDMTFTQSGNKIVGEYTHDKGRLEGVINGDVFIGTWSESPSYSVPNDAGDVELKLSKDGNSFEGNWRYGSDSSSWSGGWTGSRAGQSTASTSSGVTPGWYLIEVEDYSEVGDRDTFSLEYKRGNVLTIKTSSDGDKTLQIRTVSEEAKDFYAAEEEIAIKVRKEGALIATGNLGMSDSSHINIDMADIRPGGTTAGGYSLEDETYGDLFTMDWQDSTGDVKEGIFKANVPGAKAHGGSFAIIYTYYNGEIYGTKYIYEWRE